MPRTCPGFTLVELLVALTLIVVGVTAWIGTSTAVLRLAGAADRQAAAQADARSRASLLAVTACASIDSGATVEDRWRVDSTGAFRHIQVARRFVGANGPREAIAEGVVACR